MKKIYLAILTVFLSLSLLACIPPSEESSSSGGGELPSMTVTVSGVVVSVDQPVSGVSVTVKDSQNNVYGTIVTAEDGAFAVEDVSKTRAVIVIFEKEGFFPKEVRLSISDITSGKNAMGNVELEKPSDLRNLSGKVVGLDGEIGVAGVSVTVPGFDASAITDVNGAFEISGVPISSEGVTLVTSKDGFASVEKIVSKEEIGENGEVGLLFSYIGLPSLSSCPETGFTLVRGESSFKFYMSFDKNLAGGQNVQLMYHVGDNVSGKVYNTMLFASADHGLSSDPNFAGRSHVPFVRSIEKLIEADYECLTDEQFPSSYVYDAEKKLLVYEVPFTSLGIDADDTVGVAVLNVFLNSAANAWVYPAFGIDMPKDGSNVLNYQQFYDFSAAGEFTVRAITSAELRGVVKDEEGALLAGASIVVTDAKHNRYTTTTDSEGKYSLEVGRLYDLSVEVAKDGYSLYNGTIAVTELQASAIEKEIILLGVAGYATVKGSVKNLLGGAINGVTVTVKGTELSATTGSNGEYVLSNVPVGKSGLSLVYTAVGYTAISKDHSVDTLNMDAENQLADVEMYSEFGGDGHTKFSLVREETGIRFKFLSISFNPAAEYFWAVIKVGQNVYTYALQPNGSAAESVWGVTSIHPRFIRTVDTAFGPAEIANDTWTVSGEASEIVMDWFVPYSDLGLEKGGEFELAIAPLFYAGFPNCIPFAVNYTYDILTNPTFNTVPAECFYKVGLNNDYFIG